MISGVTVLDNDGTCGVGAGDPELGIAPAIGSVLAIGSAKHAVNGCNNKKAQEIKTRNLFCINGAPGKSKFQLHTRTFIGLADNIC